MQTSIWYTNLILLTIITDIMADIVCLQEVSVPVKDVNAYIHNYNNKYYQPYLKKYTKHNWK